MVLRTRQHAWSFPRSRPLVMGILNTNPDSVSDARPLRTPEEQVEHAEAMVRAGADMIDVGGQSGRTDRPAPTPEEEAERILPVIRRLHERRIPVSVDTFRVSVATAAVDAGATLINDVSGLADPDMARLAARSGAGLLLMHTRAAPKTEHFPEYGDIMADVLGFLRERLSEVVSLGVGSEQVVLDPGPDFAKSPSESVEILRRFEELSVLGRPLLLAGSRKYFVGMITGRPPHRRLGGSLAALGRGVDSGAHIVRVHDVAETVAFLDVHAVLTSSGAPEFRGAREDPALKWLPAGS